MLKTNLRDYDFKNLYWEDGINWCSSIRRRVEQAMKQAKKYKKKPMKITYD